MAYLVLARKWRPKTFEDIIGQEYITLALKNALSSGRIAHAFIFSGPRGVGKTSTARIVAKALNCEKGPTAKPCSTCTFCREISEGRSLDVMEIDAASHTGVSDVREIIENVKYLPSSGKTKIYIIDEAHMLSQSAFNALLKTLEEPPQHVIFILATTEAHKIPVTILSRCQRHDFKKVSVEKIRERLRFVVSTEGIEVPEETLYLIAQESDGSLRDGLSLLDQLVATFGSEITHQEAAKILGVLDRSLLKSTLKAILDKEPKRCIEILNEASDKGISPKRFSEDLLRILRDTLVIKTCGMEIVSDLSADEKYELERISASQSIESLEMLFDLTLEGAEDVHRSFYPRMTLEVTLVKLALLQSTVPLDDILRRIETLQKKIGGGNPSHRQTENIPQKGVKESDEAGKYSYEPADQDRSVQSEKADVSAPAGSRLVDFIKFVKSKKAIIGRGLENADNVYLDNGVLKVQFSSSSVHSDHLSLREGRESLRALLNEFFDQDLRIKVEVKSLSGKDNSSSATKEQIATDREGNQLDPIVKDALEIFGGRVVRTKTKGKE